MTEHKEIKMEQKETLDFYLKHKEQPFCYKIMLQGNI